MPTTMPLRSTASVFDESILKVEFLPLPVQFTDYDVNMNNEIPLHRLETIMTKIFGPVRVEGLNLNVSNGFLSVSSGLMLFKNYLVRLSQQAEIAHIAEDRVLYFAVSESKLTHESDPDIVNVNPPYAPTSLPGPNQYRYTVGLGYAAAVPADTSSVFHVKLCDVSAVGVVTNLWPLYDKKLGAFDFDGRFTAIETAQDTHTDRLDALESSLTVKLGESMTAGDLVKIVNDGGAVAQKLVCNITDGEVKIDDDGNNAYGQVTSAKLTDDKFVLLYSLRQDINGCTCYARVGTITGNKVTMWPSTLVTSLAEHAIGVTALSASKIVIGYNNYTDNKCKVQVGDIDASNVITFGNTSQPIADSSYGLVVLALSSSKIAVSINTQTAVKSIIGDISGTSFSWGSVDTVAAIVGGKYLCGDIVDAAKFVLAYYENTTGDMTSAVVVTVSGGNVIGHGGPVLVSTAANEGGPDGPCQVCVLSASTVVVRYRANTTLRPMLKAATISGTSLTFGIGIELSSNASIPFSMSKISSTKLMATWYETFGGVGAIVTLANATDLSIGAVTLLNAGAAQAFPGGSSTLVLTSTKHVSFFITTNALYAVNGSLDSSAVYCNRNLAITNLSSTFVGVALSDTRIMVVFWVYNAMKAKIGTVAGLGVTWGSEQSLFTDADMTDFDLRKVSESKVLVVTSANLVCKARICTVTGSMITTGAPTSVHSGSNHTEISCEILASSMAVVLYKDDDGLAAVCVFIAGDFSLSIGSPLTILSTGQHVSVCKVSPYRVVIAYTDSSVTVGYVQAIHLTLSGLIVPSQKVPVCEGVFSELLSLAAVGTDQFALLVPYGADVNRLEVVVGQVLNDFRVSIGDRLQIHSGVLAKRRAMKYLGGRRIVIGWLEDIGSSLSNPYVFMFVDLHNMRAIPNRKYVVTHFANRANENPTSESILVLTDTKFIALILEDGNNGSAFVLQDDRDHWDGVLQQSGNVADTKIVALRGGSSIIHSGLEIGKRYFINDAVELTTSETDYLAGKALTANKLKLNGDLS